MNRIFAASLLLGLFLTACKLGTTPERPVHALAEDQYFVQFVRPLLETKCLRCHNGDFPAGRLSLTQRSGVYVPRKRDRAYIVPGDPEASRFLTSIRPGGSHPRTTPSLDSTLTPFDLAVLHEWIEDGAYWPDNPTGFLQPRQIVYVP